MEVGKEQQTQARKKQAAFYHDHCGQYWTKHRDRMALYRNRCGRKKAMFLDRRGTMA